MFKMFTSRKFRRHRSGRSVRQGEKLASSLLRSRPLTTARKQLQSLYPPMGYALGRALTIKGRRPVPSGQSRELGHEVARFPLMSLLRPEDIFRGSMLRSLFSEDRRVLKDQLREVSTPHSICERRGARRRVLFMKKIAGKGKRKSPGTGGSYRRTPDSEGSCGRR